ncbi:MAG: hypothetical protein JSU03_07915 [Bacteroidetes bacterium]|nr:hypothetical protein [Bacteroidota bacterium]MBS1757187.1 hypothetical protein [Bacteroidota bacterium]
MRKIIFLSLIVSLGCLHASAQIDLNELTTGNIFGKIMNVKKGFAPKFSLANQPIDKIFKVAEIIGLKKNDQATRLFNTFKTGRTIYKVASYVGAAVSVYAVVRAADKAASKKDYQGALTGGISSIVSGLAVKFLTKGASYKAVDIFNGIVKEKVKDKIKDIFSIAPASNTLGIGIYAKL